MFLMMLKSAWGGVKIAETFVTWMKWDSGCTWKPPQNFLIKIKISVTDSRKSHFNLTIWVASINHAYTGIRKAWAFIHIRVLHFESIESATFPGQVHCHFPLLPLPTLPLSPPSALANQTNRSSNSSPSCTSPKLFKFPHYNHLRLYIEI